MPRRVQEYEKGSETSALGIYVIEVYFNIIGIGHRMMFSHLYKYGGTKGQQQN